MKNKMALFFSPRNKHIVTYTAISGLYQHTDSLYNCGWPGHVINPPAFRHPLLTPSTPGKKKSPFFVLPLGDLHTPTQILGGLSCVRGFRRDMSSLDEYGVTDRYVIYNNNEMRIKRDDFNWIRT